MASKDLIELDTSRENTVLAELQCWSCKLRSTSVHYRSRWTAALVQGARFGLAAAMWLRFADPRVEQAWRVHHNASRVHTDLLWCCILLLVWLVNIGKLIASRGSAPVFVAIGPALLLITVRGRAVRSGAGLLVVADALV